MGKRRKQRVRDPQPASTQASSSSSSVTLLICLSLIVVGAVVLTHWPVLSATAMSFDDEEAIIDNYLVQNPSWHSVGRFFGEVTLSSVVRGYYRPLTLTSLMLDWAMGGRADNLRPFHRTSLALHLGSTVLLILLVYQVFHRPVIAALVGLLFGVHPLTVESIAWIMERKTILAAFFAFACLNAYVRYVRCPRPGWYASAVVLYLLSLLAKPTGTPLPIILLLMDVWPLKRFGVGLQNHERPVSGRSVFSVCGYTFDLRIILEKVPFFVLSAVFAAMCVICEEKVNPLSLPARLSPLHLPLRLCWLVVFYPCKILLPMNLSSVYVLPEPLDLTNGLVLLAVSGAVLLATALVISARWTPAFWVGAAMFYIGLAPTMGFVGYSWVSASDKYVYLPAVGLVLTLGWILDRFWRGDTTGTPNIRRIAMIVVVATLAGLLGMGTRRYLACWQTSEGLLAHMFRLAPDSPQLHFAHGKLLDANGSPEGAIQAYSMSIKLKTDNPQAFNNRGIAYGKKHDFERAIRDWNKANELLPEYVGPYYNRGIALALKGDLDGAIRDFSKAVELDSGYVEAYNKRASVFLRKQDNDAAIRDFSRVIECGFGHAEAYYRRGIAYGRKGDFDAAIRDFSKAIELAPQHGEAYYNRGTAFDGKQDYARAIRDYTLAIELKPDDVQAYSNRGNTYARLNHLDRAIADYTRAIELAPDRPLAYCNRGNAWFSLGDYDKSWADVRSCRELGGTPSLELVGNLEEVTGRRE